LALKDTFPPKPPTGLAAVPNEATGTPDHASPDQASIDLSWEPNTDPDLAGYIVYRQLVDATGALTGPAIRLNPTPLPGPAYRDQTAIVGKSYAYRVTAVDTVGNESAPSADVQEKLREP
jgi:fibronectin type 3 domain-containing protein